jgi:hypothetical protein
MGIRLDITDDMSKAEEIKILDKLRDEFQKCPDNYLASLFTNSFCQWAENRIKDDFPIDVMEYIDDRSNEEEIQQLRGQVQNEIANRNALDELLKQVGAKTEESTERFQEEIIEWRRRATEQSDQLFDERAKVQERDELADALELEIVKLKAKLYDLTEEGK